jgi:acylphosphatase
MDNGIKPRMSECFLKVFYMVTRRLRISGRVQGVGYRESLRYEADKLGVCGWVRNRLDGSVEALLQGTPEKVNALIEWARRGPPAALVLKVEIETPDGQGEQRYSGFERRPTA